MTVNKNQKMKVSAAELKQNQPYWIKIDSKALPLRDYNNISTEISSC
jgi:hypothetical protein